MNLSNVAMLEQIDQFIAEQEARLTELRTARETFARVFHVPQPAPTKVGKRALRVERTNERAKRGPGRPRKVRGATLAARSLPSDADNILFVLRKHGPLKPKQIQEMLGISPFTFRARLKQLGKSVVATGATMNRQVALREAGKSAAKEAP